MSRRAVLLFGASRGAGLALARLLCERDVAVTALVRPATDAAELDALGVRVVRGDALVAGDVARAYAAAPAGAAVVSTLGGRIGETPSVDEVGNCIVIAAALGAPPERFVLITSIGCGEMSEHRSEAARAAFGSVVESKTRSERYLRETDLPYTILRPGGLRDGPATGRGVLSSDPRIHGLIGRADLALLIERVLRDRSTLGRALAAVDADHARSDAPIEPFALTP